MKWILLTVLLGTQNILAYQTIRPGTLKFDESVLGGGFDLQNLHLQTEFLQRLKSNCVTEDVVNYGQKKASFRFYNYVGFESNQEFSTIGGRSIVDFWIASAKASVQYLMEEASTSTRESNALSIRISGPNYRLENIIPNKEAMAYGSNLCGDGYVHHAEKGISQTLTAGLEFFTREKKEKFTAKLKIKLAGGLIKKTFRYKNEHREYFEDAVMTISHHYQGGMTDELLAIRDHQPTSTIRYRCMYENLDYCVNKFNEYHDYLTSEVYLTALKDESIYETLRFGVSTYEEAAIEGIAGNTQSPLLTQYSALILMSHDLQEHYSKKIKLVSEKLFHQEKSEEYKIIQNKINLKNFEISDLGTKMDRCFADMAEC